MQIRGQMNWVFSRAYGVGIWRGYANREESLRFELHDAPGAAVRCPQNHPILGAMRAITEERPYRQEPLAARKDVTRIARLAAEGCAVSPAVGSTTPVTSMR